ncbi:MAG: hypothetical protein KAT69_01025, partial [Candidatus Aminicenantes bacterium]|nr:hypothetical protein [Candidatus Aminicenantes bacterium]
MKKKLIFGFIFLLLAFGFLEAQYHFFLRANRYWSNAGVFSTDGMIQTIGTDNKIRLAYSGGRYTDIVANDEGELYIGKAITRSGDNESVLVFEVLWQGPDESRQGIIHVYGERDTAITSWGGSPDMLLKMAIRNTADNSTTGAHMRGMEIVSSNRSTTGDVVSAYLSAESRSGSESAQIMPLWLIYDQSGNVNTNHSGLYIQDNSQSNVGTNRGIFLTTTNYNQTREYAIFIDSNAGSWTNAISFNGTITSAFDFEGTDGTSAAYYEAGMTDDGSTAADLDGWIRV